MNYAKVLEIGKVVSKKYKSDFGIRENPKIIINIEYEE